VRDDGRGGADASGAGLRASRTREARGGQLVVVSAGGSGTLVEARLPLRASLVA